jgi:Ca2+-binding EF-hand superfamily protein
MRTMTISPFYPPPPAPRAVRGGLGGGGGRRSGLEGEMREMMRTCGDTLLRRFGSGERAFGFLDDDGDGKITMPELVSGLKSVGIPLSTLHVRALGQMLPHNALLSPSLFLQLFNLEGVSAERQDSARHVLDALYLMRLTLRDLFTAADSQRRGRVQVAQLVQALERCIQKESDSSHSFVGEEREAAAQLERLCMQHSTSSSTEAGGDRLLSYDEVAQLLQLPSRPVDWEQDVIHKAQRHLLSQGVTPDRFYSSLAGRSKELSKGVFVKWLSRVDPTLRLSEIEHLCSMFRESPKGVISRQAFVQRFTDAAAEERERALRWLRNQLYEHKKSLDDFLAGADKNRDGHVTKEELRAGVRSMDKVLTAAAADEIVRGLCPADSGQMVDLRSLRRCLKASAEHEQDWEHQLILRVRGAIKESGHSPESLFRLWDRDADGSITELELLQGLSSLELGLDAWETHTLLRLADADGSGSLNLSEFARRFREGDDAGGGKMKATAKVQAALFAREAQRKGFCDARELFARFAGYADTMSRSDHRLLCRSFDLPEEQEKELWRLLDPQGRGSINLETFMNCYRNWPKPKQAREGVGGATRGGGEGAGNAKAAAHFVKEEARRRRCTVHELFDSVDLDGDGLVSAEDLYTFSINAQAHSQAGRQRGVRSRSAVVSDPASKPHLLRPDFEALLSSEGGGEFVTVEELEECLEAEFREVLGAGWERDALHSLQLAFASDFAKVSLSLSRARACVCVHTQSCLYEQVLMHKHWQLRAEEERQAKQTADRALSHPAPAPQSHTAAATAASRPLRVEKRLVEKTLKDQVRASSACSLQLHFMVWCHGVV